MSRSGWTVAKDVQDKCEDRRAEGLQRRPDGEVLHDAAILPNCPNCRLECEIGKSNAHCCTMRRTRRKSGASSEWKDSVGRGNVA